MGHPAPIVHKVPGQFPVAHSHPEAFRRSKSTGVYGKKLTVVNYTEPEGSRETQILSAAEPPKTIWPGVVRMESVLS